MTDTAQPQAAETDAFAEAAMAFKVSLGQEEAPAAPARDEQGRFVSAQPEEEPEPEPGPEMPEENEPDDDAEAVEADEAEAQQEPAPLPPFWPKEDEAFWSELSPQAQARIVERETQRDAAVLRRTEEAANARKASEAARDEAQNSRAEYLQAVDQVMSLIVPQEPPTSMLVQGSSDYDPDYYHILKAQYDNSLRVYGQLSEQRQSVAAQFVQELQQREAQEEQEWFARLNQAGQDAFVKAVPDILDPAKQRDIVIRLRDYAVRDIGFPPEAFNKPTTLPEWHVLWKAAEYDRLQAAKKQVQAEPAPAPKKPAPPIRPGVTTPRSTVERQQRDKAFARLSKSGSIEDGAAVFKHLMKG